eukprot:3355142-Rhodomonas_salina.1
MQRRVDAHAKRGAESLSVRVPQALSETGSRRSSAMSYSGPGTGGAKITGLDAEVLRTLSCYVYARRCPVLSLACPVERREVLERTTVALKERAEAVPLRVGYGVSGFDLSYDAMRCYGVSGTDIGCAVARRQAPSGSAKKGRQR